MKKNIIAILFAILIICGLVQCGADETKTIPDVTGQTVPEAIQTLNDAGYHNQTLKHPDGSNAYSGTVTKQTPKAGTEQSTDTMVTLTVKDELQERMKKAAKEKAAEKAKVDKLKRTAEQLKGKNAVEAMNILEKEHMSGTVTYSTGATEDNLEQHVRDDDANGIEWVVTDATPLLADGGRIDIKVNTKTIVDAAKAQQEQSDKTSQKLSQASAAAACEQYGRRLYPAGFKTHAFTGTFTPVDDDTWSYKVTVDVTNAYGAKMKALTCECKVTGTTANPQVVEFNIY